ncbi:hypothetical protein TNCV_4971221 [Trichonephila clavipes]|nr:hypothetical protein TNCV_4971221 [Trichonephila clavipes]
MTVSSIWNRWVQGGNTECHAGAQRPLITSSREDRRVTRMNLMDCAATSRALGQELGSCQTHGEDKRNSLDTKSACVKHLTNDIMYTPTSRVARALKDPKNYGFEILYVRWKLACQISKPQSYATYLRRSEVGNRNSQSPSQNHPRSGNSIAQRAAPSAI